MASVYIRERKMRSGKTYLYLQYKPAIRNPRTMKYIQWEALHLRVFPKNDSDWGHRQITKDSYEAATYIQSKRILQLASNEYGIVDKYRKQEDAIPWIKELVDKHNNNSKWRGFFRHFTTFVNGKCRFADMDENFSDRFKEYLLTTMDTQKGVKLNANAAAGYFGVYRQMLKQAYREHWLDVNVNDFLTNIKCKKVIKPFLTIDEVKKLYDTEFYNDELKRASLFSCFTGLRISDILNLRWENIVKNDFGGYSFNIVNVKNDVPNNNPISDEAMEFLGFKKLSGKVFPHLNRQMLYTDLPELIKAAGINKHITFHCFRHTYATLQVSMGTDIYTVSKMLNHSSVQTTQIYADIVSEKKLEATRRITLKN